MPSLCIIPARYSSSRLPGKVLRRIGGRTLLEQVFRACLRARCFDRIVIATDSPLIVSAAESFGAETLLTPKKCRNGTERTAAVAQSIPAKLYINVQADQPYLSPRLLRQFVTWAKSHSFPVATLASPLLRDRADSPACVKVVFNEKKEALFFSRSCIPYSRDGAPVRRFQHIGIYSYRRKALLRYPRLSVPSVERAEKLEQLRFLAHKIPIHLLIVRSQVVSIDTEEDLQAIMPRDA